MSKVFTETECNYKIYDKEMLSIMIALNEWRQYLMGASKDFEIWTDHQNLQYFRKPQKLNRQQARWMTELSEYHFTLHHKPGKTHVKPDILSRRPDLEKGEGDNENLVLLKSEHFRRVEFGITTLDQDFVKRIHASAKARDKVVKRSLLKKHRDYKEEDGIITMQERIYVPKDRELREDIIREHHDSIVAGHPGRYKTQELITKNYWWPYIQADIHKYINGCETVPKDESTPRKTPQPTTST